MRVRSQRLSFNLRVIPGVTELFAHGDLPHRLATARAHGFTGVEGSVPEDPAELARMLDREGMHFVCMSTGRGNFADEAFGIATLPGRQDEFRDAILRGIEAATALSCTMIHPVGGLVAPHHRLASRALYMNNLQIACEEARSAGIHVLIEPICSSRQLKIYPADYVDAITIIQSLGIGNLFLLADMYHAQITGESILEIFHQYAGLIGFLQAADAQIHRQPSIYDEVLRAAVKALVEHHWHGWISAEYVAQGDFVEFLAWISLIEKVLAEPHIN